MRRPPPWTVPNSESSGEMKIGDLSTARPGGALLRANGYGGVMRYAAEGRDDVNITAPEYADYTDHGVLVGIVCEFEADFMLRRNGVTCANGVMDVCRAAALPVGVTYYAGDFDATLGGYTFPGSPGDANVTQIAAFLNDAASIQTEELVGVYGSYFLCYALAQKLPWLKWFWQTEAWSQGMNYGPRVLFQYADKPSGVIGVDLDATSSTFWGQRIFVNPSKLSTLVIRLPLLRYGDTGSDVALLQKAMNQGSHAQLVPDGVFGTQTDAAVRQTQKFWHLVEDGIAGPQTDRAIAFELASKGL